MIKKIFSWFLWGKKAPETKNHWVKKKWIPTDKLSETNQTIHNILTWTNEEPKEIEFDQDLIDQYNLWDYIQAAEEQKKVEEKEKRTYRRFKAKEILGKKIDVIIHFRLSINNTILSNISWSWIQVISDSEMTIWEIWGISFKIWNDKFKFNWEIVNKLWENKYGIRFLNPDKEKVRNIELLLWSTKRTNK